jgi:hypothetical protein
VLLTVSGNEVVGNFAGSSHQTRLGKKMMAATVRNMPDRENVAHRVVRWNGMPFNGFPAASLGAPRLNFTPSGLLEPTMQRDDVRSY